MEFSLDGNLWVELPPLGDGKYMLSNTYGYNFPARYYFRATNKGNAAQNFVFNFTANMVDDYTYVSPTEQVYTDVLYTTTASGLVLGAPTIEITQGEFPATIACGTNYDFVITAEGNCYEGTDIRTKIELDPLSAADSLDIYFSPDGSTWLPIEYDSEGISWFGPATGIPFGELIVPFRFVNKGSAENDVPVSVTVSIYECTSDGSSCVADVTSALVTKTYNTVIIGGPSIVYDPELDELPAEIFCGNDYDFAIATTTGCYDDQSLMVIAKIQLSPNVSDLVDVQYWEGGYETGTLYPLPFDENGVTAFGPFDTGFPLSNLTSYFRVASNPTVTEDTPFEVTISLYPIENFSWDGETFTFTGTPLAAMEIASTIMFVPTNTITLISAPGTDAQWTSFEDPIIPIIYATTGATGAEFKGLPDGVTGVWENNEVIITGVPTHPGYYKYTVITTGGCGVDSAMGTIKVCEPYIIDEVNGEQYSIRALQGNCWFTDNLRGYKYNDGSDIEPVPTQYYNEYNPYMPVDVSIFGLLYTWAAAFPEATTKSGEKSLCPDGWHMPSVAELATLTAYDAKDLKNPLYWLTPNNNTNATEFNAVGAGFFNGASNRYEDLYGYTAFWSTANPANMAATVIGAVLTYNCNVIQLLQIPVANAISVRCVMDLDEE
jgi:uncharacterized protein (TIGR02145 family)